MKGGKTEAHLLLKTSLGISCSVMHALRARVSPPPPPNDMFANCMANMHKQKHIHTCIRDLASLCTTHAQKNAERHDP